MRVIVSYKKIKTWSRFQNLMKKLRIFFLFLDNLIWICCVKLSLLRKEYLSLAVTVLANSPKILHITNRVFSNSLSFTVTNKYGKMALVQISTVFATVYHVACPSVLLTGLFTDASSHVFRNPKFRKCISFGGYLLFENVQNFI